MDGAEYPAVSHLCETAQVGSPGISDGESTRRGTKVNIIAGVFRLLPNFQGPSGAILVLRTHAPITRHRRTVPVRFLVAA